MRAVLNIMSSDADSAQVAAMDEGKDEDINNESARSLQDAEPVSKIESNGDERSVHVENGDDSEPVQDQKSAACDFPEV